MRAISKRPKRSQRHAQVIVKIRKILKKPFRAEPNEYKERYEKLEQMLKELIDSIWEK